VANHPLTENFRYFFSRLNPSPTFEQIASREHSTIRGLIEKRDGPASVLSPRCFLQGSFKQQTATYSINDVDLVVLCNLWYPGAGGNVRSYGRDEIFQIVAAPLLADGRYCSRVFYGPTSMCIKVDLGIKVEILPVVFKAGTNDWQAEPFVLYRPEKRQWEDGYARLHQQHLTEKNHVQRTNGNFIPAVKVFKHLNTSWKLGAVSFHIECLTYSLPDYMYWGSPADYIGALCGAVAETDAATSYQKGLLTPCRERNIFAPGEWGSEQWSFFHKACTVCAKGARVAREVADRTTAIECWRTILGEDFFPATVS
jgi:hypothetical protein